MKKLFIFFLFTVVSAQSNGQQSVDLQSDLAEVSININSGDDTYNLEDLIYHAKRASVAIKKVISSLEASSSCNNALEFSNEISGLLDTAMVSDNHGDGRINISLCKELITKTFYEYDLCAVKGNGNEALTDLEQQQSILKLQQKELELKTKEINRKLAEQKEKKTFLEKQNFIDTNKEAFSSNVRVFNDQLKACGCDGIISSNSTDNLADLKSKSLAEIKAHYIDKVLSTTKAYMDKLTACKN